MIGPGCKICPVEKCETLIYREPDFYCAYGERKADVRLD